MFEINVFGLSRMIHAALLGMRKRRKGFIVNFSSVGGNLRLRVCPKPSGRRSNRWASR